MPLHGIDIMSKHITRMEIDDAEHFTPEERQAIIDSYPEHEREARTKGIPSLGSGRVFPISEEKILCEPISIPNHWYQIIGVDFGWEHPFAATRNVWDKDNAVWYVTASYREAKAIPPIHYAAIRPWGRLASVCLAT
jgi:Terminase large subunit, T4likevirus-type, N-terminal